MVQSLKTAPAISGICPNDGPYKGQTCQCANCCHIEGVCISHESGSGCHACEGPVENCDLTDYDNLDESNN